MINESHGGLMVIYPGTVRKKITMIPKYKSKIYHDTVDGSEIRRSLMDMIKYSNW